MRARLFDLLGYVGFAVASAGLAMWETPAGVVAAGVSLIAVSYLEARS
jgi:hypothetical protein